ncbi:MAG: amino acid adenylation domain-containing protein [Methylobacter sp.]
MMLTELLATLGELNVRLYVEDGALKCKAPTNILTDEIKSLLKTRKEELIEILSSADEHNDAPITPVLRIDPIPLSYAQQRLWFLDQLDPGSASYNTPIVLRITGRLNISALEQSMNEIVRRHESLRTSFVTVNGQPTQKVRPDILLPVMYVNLAMLPEQIREITMRGLCRQEAAKPFALSTDPLIRITLITLFNGPDTQEYILLVTLHHIVSDGWSSALLMREFIALYQAFGEGKESPLTELTIQYADFACWQRQWLSGDVLQRQIDYWQKQLSGIPDLLELPADRPRPPAMSYCGANYMISIPLALVEQLRALSRQHNTTLFMTLFAVFNVLLFRYSHQQDVCVGTPVANRNKLQIEGLIGFFVNTLVLRTDLSGDPQFDELLAQIKSTVLNAQNHQDLPFEQVVDMLKPERSRSYNPLFQIWFTVHNAMQQSPAMPGLSIAGVEGEDTVSKFDLALHVQEQDSGLLTGIFEYNTDLFEHHSIVRLAEHYLSLLQGIVNRPQARLSELPLLTQAEKRQILIDWNDTKADYPEDYCLHQLFEKQVETAPHAIAVVFGEQVVSYAELNTRANQLAHFLRSKGVRTDVLVGLCVERSLEMIIGLLGILKAGGAYVPLDPDYPHERLQYMMKDTQASILLTQQQLIGKLPACAGETIFLDRQWPEVSQYHANNPVIQNNPLDMAYIIYTSGSTGKPKGVMVSHRNAVHSTLARFSAYQDRVRAFLLLSSFAFDSSVAGIFWTLGRGGCLCLPSHDGAKDPSILGAIIVQRQVSHLLALPSLYALLLKQLPDQLQSLKEVIVAGESCPSEVVKHHYAVLPGAHLYNEYGPTEATVWSSVYSVRSEDADRTLSIGRPIDNVQLYLLDRMCSPVPVGVQGELYIGGAGLARGYLNNPELSAEKFIPNPFDETGSRLYKTGDLARYRRDGNIEFLGRMDHQVKIRGFRIELGEIETQLLEHPGVKETVVLAREHKPGNKQLIAYVVGNSSCLSDADTLRTHLKAILPEYMLPSAFVFLESMPLSANGKIDRKSLLTINADALITTKHILAATPTEKKLAELWAELLKIELPNSSDDFFDLGGHSLLAIELVFVVQKAFNVELMLVDIFERPTLAEQARLIDGEVTNHPQKEILIELESDAELDSGIIPISPIPINVAESQALFLTGATGFLGAFLLAELLKQTRADIYCLIRADNEQEAAKRLKQQLFRYELLEKLDFRRIIPVCGDLSSPQLGLTEQRYREIAIRVDAIYHNGALVNFIQPYRALKPANVLGTQEVLRLACTEKNKAIHYVSTLSVFSEMTSDHPHGFAEYDEPRLSEHLDNGYAQSKWVAEKLVRTARDRGFQVSIYRPATVAGDSHSGVWNIDDFLCRLLKGCIQLGFVPDGNSRLDMATVDYMSRAIVSLSLRPVSIGACFHLNHPTPPYSDELIDWFSRSGYCLKRIPHQAWVKKVLETAEADYKDFALSPLLPMFSDRVQDDEMEFLEENTIRYDCSETQSVLLKLGIECALLDDELLARYQTYFNRCGFVREPEYYKEKLFLRVG